MNKRYYINVKQVMDSYLPRPRRKPVIYVTGWGEWLQIIGVETQ